MSLAVVFFLQHGSPVARACKTWVDFWRTFSSGMCFLRPPAQPLLAPTHPAESVILRVLSRRWRTPGQPSAVQDESDFWQGSSGRLLRPFLPPPEVRCSLRAPFAWLTARSGVRRTGRGAGVAVRHVRADRRCAPVVAAPGVDVPRPLPGRRGGRGDVLAEAARQRRVRAQPRVRAHADHLQPAAGGRGRPSPRHRQLPCCSTAAPTRPSSSAWSMRAASAASSTS